MKEGPIEQHLRQRVKKAGGKVYKWVSPGNKGVPDDIVFLRGMIFLAEIKSTNGELSAVQRVQHKKLSDLGVEVVVLNSKQQVEDWVDMQVRCL